MKKQQSSTTMNVLLVYTFSFTLHVLGFLIHNPALKEGTALVKQKGVCVGGKNLLKTGH